ncbi:phage tail assembly protein [Rivihabitans pingtungensis]|uniref:phage tail assembly protein n=1 Tax=Rivihabitans pingtungensis TaxID=1054498 RepID=UPI00235412F9|nr:phage tail assembly protein [Rivihabitans pingtungensis]MCK6435961.1 phage tail assembly protein [Rivihabitans pingtungensis]
MTKQHSENLPAWLAVGADSITITLSRASSMNGIKQNKVTLRTPTIGDLRAAYRHSKDDKESQEIFLFASLAECAPADIEGLSVRDYNRVQDGYFRLIAEDDSSGAEAASETAGH